MAMPVLEPVIVNSRELVQMDVQFESADVGRVRSDFGVIGILADIMQSPGRLGGRVVAYYERGRPALKLRNYLESHHCLLTVEGKIETLPVDGWELLLEASTNLH